MTYAETNEEISGVVIFPDTNILMQYQPIENIDWLTMVGASTVQLVIPPEVLDELEKHKQDSNSRRQKRARSVLSRFREIKAKRWEVRPGVSLSFGRLRVTDTDVSGFGLDPKSTDHRIITQILLHRLSSQNRALFCADDFGAQTRAEEVGVEVLELSETLRLAAEADPKDADIAELQKKVRALEASTAFYPELKLEFENGTNFLEYVIHPIAPRSSEGLKLAAEDHLNQFPAYVPPAKSEVDAKALGIFGAITNFLSSEPSEDEIRRYTKERESYLRSFPAYLYQSERTRVTLSLTLPLPIKISNAGKAPAVGVRVWIHFPDGFVIPEKALRVPDPPKAPIRPRRDAEFILKGLSEPFLPLVPHQSLPGAGMSRSNVSSPSIKKTNSYEVEQRVDKLLHTGSILLSTFQICFESVGDVKPFTIGYKLIAENTPEPFEGQLHVKVCAE